MEQEPRSAPPPSDEWFHLEPRYSLPPSASVPPPPPKLPSIARSLFAGVVVGAISGAASLVVATLLAKRDVSRLPEPMWFGAACAIGIAIAVLIALGTRHVRRALPLAMFGAIFGPVVWLGLHVSVLRRYARLVDVLPLGPMLGGVALFGLLLAIIVPLRGRN